MANGYISDIPWESYDGMAIPTDGKYDHILDALEWQYIKGDLLQDASPIACSRFTTILNCQLKLVILQI